MVEIKQNLICMGLVLPRAPCLLAYAVDNGKCILQITDLAKGQNHL